MKKPKKPTKRYWSADVTSHSNALDLEDGVFKLPPAEMAKSLKRSADRSARRKAKTPFRSAMSMLVFYENRAGKKLSPTARRRIERAKDELRKLYDR